MWRKQEVTFSARGQLTCNTTQRHKQQWKEERDARFLAGNTDIILSSCQLKMRILRFVVHSMLATKHYQALKPQRQIWRNIWSRSTVKSTEQVLPGGVKQRAASKATASTSAGGLTPPKQLKLDFGAKQLSRGKLKKLVGQDVVEAMLHLNTVDSPSFCTIINKIPATINAMLPLRTSLSSCLNVYVEAVGIHIISYIQPLLKVTCNLT